MKKLHCLSLVCTLTAALLAGCQSPVASTGNLKSPEQDSVAVDAQCVVTPPAFAHITARHCTATSGASQLLPQYCTNAAAAQNFCRMVQSSPNKTRAVQPDGRIRYDANLGTVVGTAGEKCGRLIIETNGNVVTEFPELNGAPGTCN